MAGARCSVDLRLDGVGGGSYRLRVGDEVSVDHPEGPPPAEGCIAGDAVAVFEAISGRGDLSAARGPQPLVQRVGLLAVALAGA
jgi:hypothetical protein